MLTDGIQLLPLSIFTLSNGSALPATGTEGELFYKTGAGLFIYDASAWAQIGAGAAGSGITSISMSTGSGIVSSVDTTSATTPVIHLTLGSITPISVNTGAITATTLTFSGTLSASGSVGTAGQVLISGGSGASPAWGAIPTPSGAINATSIVLGTDLGTGVMSTATITGANANNVSIIGGYGNYNGVAGGAVTLKGGRGGNSNGTSVGIGGNVNIQGGLSYDGTAIGGDIIISTGAGTLTERLRIKGNGAWSLGSTGSAYGNSGQVLTSQGSAASPIWSDPGSGSGSPYEVPLSIQGLPTAAAKMLNFVITRPFSLPASLTGSFAKAGTAGTTSAAVFTITKNGTSIGSISFAAGATSGTFTFTTAASFVAGDLLVITSPTTQNAALADVAINLLGTLS